MVIVFNKDVWGSGYTLTSEKLCTKTTKSVISVDIYWRIMPQCRNDSGRCFITTDFLGPLTALLVAGVTCAACIALRCPDLFM